MLYKSVIGSVEQHNCHCVCDNCVHGFYIGTNDMSPGTRRRVVQYHVAIVLRLFVVGKLVEKSICETPHSKRIVLDEKLQIVNANISPSQLNAFILFGSHAIECPRLCLPLSPYLRMYLVRISISYLDVILPFLLIVVIIWFIYGIVMDSTAKARADQNISSVYTA